MLKLKRELRWALEGTPALFGLLSGEVRYVIYWGFTGCVTKHDSPWLPLHQYSSRIQMKFSDDNLENILNSKPQGLKNKSACFWNSLLCILFFFLISPADSRLQCSLRALEMSKRWFSEAAPGRASVLTAQSRWGVFAPAAHPGIILLSACPLTHMHPHCTCRAHRQHAHTQNTSARREPTCMRVRLKRGVLVL